MEKLGFKRAQLLAVAANHHLTTFFLPQGEGAGLCKCDVRWFCMVLHHKKKAVEENSGKNGFFSSGTSYGMYYIYMHIYIYHQRTK
jgi:hypothetical protein